MRCNSIGIEYQLHSQSVLSNTLNCCVNCSPNSFTQKMMMNDQVMAIIGGINSTRFTLACDFAWTMKEIVWKNQYLFLSGGKGKTRLTSCKTAAKSELEMLNSVYANTIKIKNSIVALNWLIDLARKNAHYTF